MGELDDEGKQGFKPKDVLSNKEKFFWTLLFIGLNALAIWFFYYIGMF